MAKPTGKQSLVKKGWVPILAPKMFNEQLIGESFLAEPTAAIGRIVTVSMMTLTGDPQRQQINLSFKIIGKSPQGLTTELISYKYSPASMRRFVRRGKSKLDDSFTAVTMDGKKMRIKPTIVARGNAQGGVSAALKKFAREFFILHLSKMKLDQFWSELVSHNIQKGLADAIRKIYPVGACEIRWVLIEGEGTPAQMEEPVAAPVEPVEAAQ